MKKAILVLTFFIILFVDPIFAGDPKIRTSQKHVLPIFDLVRLDGSTVAFRKSPDAIVIVAFWATWCKPCRDNELPGLAALRKEIPNKNLVILMVSNDAEKKTVQEYLNHPDINFGTLEYSMFYDPKYVTYHAILGKDVAEVHPYAVIFDRKGHMVGKFVGRHSWLSMPNKKWIQGLLSKR